MFVEEVCDIKWNPGEDVFVIYYATGNMSLYAMGSSEANVVFEPQSNQISSLAWMDNVSGDFVTSTNKVGALRMWNAAHTEPRSMIKIGPHGIKKILPASNDLFILQSCSGSVMVYNIRHRKLLFESEVAHAN